MPRGSPALFPPHHSLPYSQPFRRKPSEFRRILSRALLRRVFRFDRALPSSKNTMTVSWQRSLLVNSDSHRRTFSNMLFRDGYEMRRIEARFVCPYIRYMFSLLDYFWRVSVWIYNAWRKYYCGKIVKWEKSIKNHKLLL